MSLPLQQPGSSARLKAWGYIWIWRLACQRQGLVRAGAHPHSALLLTWEQVPR